MWKKIGHRYVSFDAAGEGGGGGDGGAHPVAPWSAAGAEMWNVGEGEAAKPWFAGIPEEPVRQMMEAKAYKNPAELAMAYHNLQKLQRNDGTVVSLPGDNATPEELSAFYGKLGRPEAPEGYAFQFGEGVKPDEGMVKFAQTAFHAAGLTPKQAQIVAEKWNEFAEGQNTALTGQVAEQNQAELDALATKWGANLEAHKASALRVMNAVGVSPELVSKVEQHIGSAAVVELLALIGSKSGEGKFLNNGGGGDPNDPATMTPQQAQAKITSLNSDPAFMAKYTNGNDPGHAEAVKLMERLYSRV